MSTTPTKETLCKYLNNYLFHKVWNSIESEYRGNIIARCITPKAVSNRLNLTGGTVVLPDSNRYYIYSIPQTCLRGLRVRTNVWEKLSDYLHTNYLDLRITTDTGLWLYRDMIFVAGHPTEKAFLLAVNASMMTDLAGADYNFKKLFVSVYYDSNKGTSITSKYIFVTKTSERNDALVMTQESGVNLVFLNGKVASGLNYDQIKLGDYVEAISDPDVFADFTIDLTDEDACRFYRSTKSGTFNYIVHIPKSYNPNNRIITHNQVDFYLRPTSGVNPNIKGRFIHRFNTNETIGQLTHNDFWISEKLIQSYMTEMNTTDLELRVICRNGRKDQYLIEDGDYLEQLYINDDATILDFLEGNRDEVPFWQASHLENSLYVELMFKSILTNPIDVSTLKSYISAIGYYNVINTLSTRTFSCKYPFNPAETYPNYVSDFSVILPINLYAASNLYVNLWIDGKMMNHDSFYTKRLSTDNLEVCMKDGHAFYNTCNVILEIFEKSAPKAEFVSCASSTVTLTTGTDAIDIYEKKELSKNAWESNYISKGYDLTHFYKKVAKISDIGSYKDGVLTFEGQQGKTYLVVNKEAFIEMTNISYTKDIVRGNVIISGPIWVNATNFTDGSNVRVPLIWDVFPAVYVNGRELALGLDFSYNTEKTSSGDFICRTINVNNTQYFKTFELHNSASDWYTVTCTGNEFTYVLGTGTFLIVDKDKIKIDTDSVSASTELVHLLNTDVSEYGDIVTSTTSVVKKYNVPKDVYLLRNTGGRYEIIGLTLQEKDTGLVEAYFTTDKCFNHNVDFFIENTSTKRDILLYYHPSLSMVFADGVPVYSVDSDKYSHYTATGGTGTIRDGALLYQRSMVPYWLASVLEEYEEERALDIERLNTVLKYLESVYPHDYPETVVIPHSHHVTSVMLNTIIKDIVNGKFAVTYDPDAEHMLTQITQYLDIKNQDAALSGVVTDIDVNKAGLEICNGTYGLKDTNASGSNRVWTNTERGTAIRWYATNGDTSARWKLEDTNCTKTYYYALDPNGTEDPWNLNWLKGDDGTDTPPVMQGGIINLRFIDFDVTYTETTQLSIEQVKAIKQLAKALYPVDATTDMEE